MVVDTPGIPKSRGDRDRNEKPAGPSDANPAVRFATTVEEISAPAPQVADTNTRSNDNTPDAIHEAMQDKLRELSTTLLSSELQAGRLSRFAFDPYSLPATRVCHRLFWS